ncbi:NUDIX domain-containing protein [Kitasatospora griseola]|uniref:NUDIX domain-containing protein n=1 Tax=Kitasatospora griseola TaxID=2064 RepID=UPI0019ADE761|nr:NUDIX domain-containing protein [Kitasatospora griseola]GGQ94703.1 hypothetical protein GCM10010195_58220 [Kitasatospora griseola]
MGHTEIPRDNHPRRRAGCVCVATDEDGLALFVRTLYGKGLILPGGAAFGGEPFHTAARRELAEETGMHLEPGKLVAVDQVKADPDTGSNEGVNFVFDLGVLGADQVAALRVPVGAVSEIGGFEWVHPDDFDSHPDVAPYTARRVREALKARADGRWLPLLQEGVPVPH